MKTDIAWTRPSSAPSSMGSASSGTSAVGPQIPVGTGESFEQGRESVADRESRLADLPTEKLLTRAEELSAALDALPKEDVPKNSLLKSWQEEICLVCMEFARRFEKLPPLMPLSDQALLSLRSDLGSVFDEVVGGLPDCERSTHQEALDAAKMLFLLGEADFTKDLTDPALAKVAAHLRDIDIRMDGYANVIRRAPYIYSAVRIIEHIQTVPGASINISSPEVAAALQAIAYSVIELMGPLASEGQETLDELNAILKNAELREELGAAVVGNAQRIKKDLSWEIALQHPLPQTFELALADVDPHHVPFAAMVLLANTQDAKIQRAGPQLLQQLAEMLQGGAPRVARHSR